MSIEYNVSQDGLRIETYPAGTLDVKETLTYFDNLQNDERIKQSALEIVNFKFVTEFNISFTESEFIIYRYQNARSKRLIRATIFVCENSLAFGIGRMLQALHEMADPKHKVVVVRSESELQLNENSL